MLSETIFQISEQTNLLALNASIDVIVESISKISKLNAEIAMSTEDILKESGIAEENSEVVLNKIKRNFKNNERITTASQGSE